MPNDLNLKAMEIMKEVFKLLVGYLDHIIGIEVPILAVTLGVQIIRNMAGPDHSTFLQLNEL